MGKRAINNFTKRFGNPPRIILTFEKVGPEEDREDAMRVFSAYKRYAYKPYRTGTYSC